MQLILCKECWEEYDRLASRAVREIAEARDMCRNKN
jgi:hypothetical protein